ncbi:MAG: macro domain-containing protein, partial [Eubacteriales bacterium]|nr:macro domain-containing protein [Eubacteriales bacterium]
EYGCKTVDFPSISTGVYHFPLAKAAEIAVKTITGYLAQHPEIERVRMVCFNEQTAVHYEKALRDCGG